MVLERAWVGLDVHARSIVAGVIDGVETDRRDADRLDGAIAEWPGPNRAVQRWAAGNTHARRLLVEAAWHHRKPYRPSRALLARQAGQPAVVRQRAERGHLCTVLEPAGHCRSSSLSSRRARRASARATRPASVMV